MSKKQIVCRVTASPQSEGLEFQWSEGARSSGPYHLTGLVLQSFDQAVAESREALLNIAEHSRDQHLELLPADCLTLARAGFDLYQSLFPPRVGEGIDPDMIREWLENLRDSEEIASVEVLLAGSNTGRSVPWNVVYDQPPNPDWFQATAEPDKQSRVWRPFWGVRYNLAIGRNSNLMQQMPWKNQEPHVVFIVDPSVLPENEWAELQAFANRHGYPILQSRDALDNYRSPTPVDLLYWLCHADPSALILGGWRIDPVNLFRVCQRLFRRQPRGLVVLNACQTAVEGGEGSYIEALHAAGLSGMVATEGWTLNIFANRFGIALLQAFLIDGVPIGEALQNLRAGGSVSEPLGLLYGAYCPPYIRVVRPPADAPGE